MTLDDLADLPPDKLEALTDAELETILKPYYIVTRPEQIQRAKPVSQQSVMASLSPQKQAALKALEEEGIDLDFLRRKKR